MISTRLATAAYCWYHQDFYINIYCPRNWENVHTRHGKRAAACTPIVWAASDSSPYSPSGVCAGRRRHLSRLRWSWRCHRDDGRLQAGSAAWHQWQTRHRKRREIVTAHPKNQLLFCPTHSGGRKYSNTKAEKKSEILLPSYIDFTPRPLPSRTPFFPPHPVLSMTLRTRPFKLTWHDVTLSKRYNYVTYLCSSHQSHSLRPDCNCKYPLWR